MNRNLDYHDYENDYDEFNQEWEQPLNVMCKSSQAKASSDDTALDTEHRHCVVHIDIDCFYAQVEMLCNPELQNKPLGVQQKNIIITTNYLARQLGVPKSTYVSDAVKNWPQLVLVNGEDLTKYRLKSYEISEFLQKYSPQVERLGFDENFIDVTQLVSWRMKDHSYKEEFIGFLHKSSESEICCKCGCYLRLQIASQIASDIRSALQKELGITCSAGIAHNKLLAKLIGATHKPNQQTTILPSQAVEFMLSLPSVRSIPGIGVNCAKSLQKIGISTVFDLQNADQTILAQELGTTAADILVKCSLGVDISPVNKFGLPQSMSDEDSFKCCNSFEDSVIRIKSLINNLLKRVCEDGRIPQTIRLTIRRALSSGQTGDHYRKRESRQCSIPKTVFNGFHNQFSSQETTCELLIPIATVLFKKIIDVSKPFHLTLISVTFTNFTKIFNNKGKINSYFSKSSDCDNKQQDKNFLSEGEATYEDFKRTESAEQNNDNSNTQTEFVNDSINGVMVDNFNTALCQKDKNSLTTECKKISLVCDSQNVTLPVFLNASTPNESILFSKKRSHNNSMEFTAKSRRVTPEETLKPDKYSQSEEIVLLNIAEELAAKTSSKSDSSFSHSCNEDVTLPETEKNTHSFFKKTCAKTTQKLPAGIDPSVFSELPKNIQAEILAHIAMASSPKLSKPVTNQSKTLKNGKLEGKHPEKSSGGILKYFSKNS